MTKMVSNNHVHSSDVSVKIPILFDILCFHQLKHRITGKSL